MSATWTFPLPGKDSDEWPAGTRNVVMWNYEYAQSIIDSLCDEMDRLDKEHDPLCEVIDYPICWTSDLLLGYCRLRDFVVLERDDKGNWSSLGRCVTFERGVNVFKKRMKSQQELNFD